MSAHTPGPWTIPARDSGVTVNASHGIVAEVYAVDVGTTQQANAKLIAAAPDMAEALRNFIGFAKYHEMEKANPRLQLQMLGMRAALAKAGL